MGDNSKREELSGVPLKSEDDILGSAPEGRPTDIELAGKKLAEHNRRAIFEFEWEKAREVAKHYKVPETPDEKLRFIEALIRNCKTERLR